MLRLLFLVLGLIALAMVGGAYFAFDPSWLILAIIGLGIFMVGRIGGPALPPGSRRIHWGSGHGIHFDRDDVWVNGRNADDGGAAKDERHAREPQGP